MTTRQIALSLIISTSFLYSCKHVTKQVETVPEIGLNEINELILKSKNKCLVKTFMEYDDSVNALGFSTLDTPSIVYEQTIEKCTINRQYTSYSAEFHNSKELSKYTFYLKNESLIIASLLEVTEDKQLDYSIYFDENELPYMYVVNESNSDKDPLKMTSYKLSDESKQDYLKAKVIADYKKTLSEFL